MIRKKRRPKNPFKPHVRSRREIKRATYPEKREAARLAAWERAGGRCGWPNCGRYVTLAAMHAHEVLFRSLGGDATDEANVLCLCGECHGKMHGCLGGNLKKILVTDRRRFFERENGHAPWREVGREQETAMEGETQAADQAIIGEHAVAMVVDEG